MERPVSELIDALKRFLETPGNAEMPQVSRGPFVTLTRQEGLGSHEVGRAIISRLDQLPDWGWNHGWELMDQQLFAWMIKTNAVPASFDELMGERFGEQGLQQMVYEMLVGAPEQYEVRNRVGRVMEFLLRFGRVVVVGSSAAAEAVPLKNPGLRLRVVSSQARRIELLQSEKQCSADAARKLLSANDAARARLLREHYRRDIDDPALYDVVFLADRLTPDQMARAAVVLLEARMEPLMARGRQPVSISTPAI